MGRIKIKTPYRAATDRAFNHSQQNTITMTATTKLSNTAAEGNLGFAQTIAKMEGTHTIEVSPALAKRWLEFNTRNRRISEVHVERLAKTMKAGDWTLNGQGLIFSETGTLLDGQHRLLAVVRSGKTILFDVRFGLHDDVMPTLDEGRKRTAGDLLAIDGMKNASNVAAASRLVMKYDIGLSERNTGAKNPSNLEILRWLSDNPLIQEVVSVALKYVGMGVVSPIAPSRLAAYIFICQRKDKDLSFDFFYKVATGVGLSFDSVEFKLRHRLLQGKGGNLKFSPEYMNGLTATAWNHVRNGNTPGVLKYTPKKGVVVKFN